MYKLKEYLNAEVYPRGGCSFSKKMFYKYSNPSTNAVYLIRKMQHWAQIRKGNCRVTAVFATHFINYYYKTLAKRYGVFINPDLTIGMGLRLPHPNGIIIGANGVGDNVIIYQQVTIGSAHIGDYNAVRGPKQPIIGNNTVLFAGAKVIGNIIVADNTVIGTNSVLNSSTEQGGVYVGSPAKRIK